MFILIDIHIIQICSGITRGRLFNGEHYAQILQKLIYLQLLINKLFNWHLCILLLVQGVLEIRAADLLHSKNKCYCSTVSFDEAGFPDSQTWDSYIYHSSYSNTVALAGDEHGYFRPMNPIPGASYSILIGECLPVIHYMNSVITLWLELIKMNL